jgi:uncharacterized damage-inducible protein DinB
MSADYLRSHWSDVRSKLIETIDKFSDADLDFQPFAGAYSVRQSMLHIAHEELGEVQHGITRALAAWPDDFGVDSYVTVSAVKGKLDEVHSQTLTLLQNLDNRSLAQTVETPWGSSGTREELLGHVLEHEIHHRAELSLILGLLGRQGLDA